VSNKIDHKYFFESENILKFLDNIKNCKILCSDELYIQSLKNGIESYKDIIKTKISKYDNETIYNFTINQCFPDDFYLNTSNTGIVSRTMKFIKDTNINLDEIITKLVNISKINNQVMRSVLLFLLVNTNNDKAVYNYLNMLNIRALSVSEYINVFGVIENMNVYKTVLNYFKNDKDIQANIIIANKNLFIQDSPEFTMNEKVIFLNNNFSYFGKVFINEFVDNIKSRNIIPENLLELLVLYTIEPSKKLITFYPELINYTDLSTDIVDEVIDISVDNEIILDKLLKFNGITSEYVISKLLETYIKCDFEIYIQLVRKFMKDVKINRTDIINECKNNSNLLNCLLKDKFFTEEEICEVIKIKNKTNTFTLTQCEESIIIDYLDKFTKDEMTQYNIFGFPQLFTFCITENVTKKVFDCFNPLDEDISKLTDKLGRNIYSYCAQFGMFDMIPKQVMNYEFILRIIMNSKSDSQLKKYLDKVIKEPVFNEVDKENNSLMIQMIKYRPTLFKTYFGSTYFAKLVDSLNNINTNNETYLMNLIKYSEDTDIMFVLNKLLTNKVLKLNMCYVDINYGSILTFAIKYSQEFAKKLIMIPFINEVLNDLSYVYDVVPLLINPYSATCYEKNVRLNLLQIAALYDTNTLRFLMKNLLECVYELKRFIY
jgi:hypothetical protein